MRKESKNNVVLTEEVYESIINNSVKAIVELKKEQTQSISKITEQKEILKNLREQFKKIKIDIKRNKRNLRKEKGNLNIINNKLSEMNNSMTNLNYNFIAEEESAINPQEYELKKR